MAEIPLSENAQTPRLALLVRDLQRVYPLQPTDTGHFLCLVSLEGGGIYTVHGILTESAIANMLERVMEPAAAQLEVMITEAANRG